MLRIVLAQCLLSVLSIYCYQPFGIYFGNMFDGNMFNPGNIFAREFFALHGTLGYNEPRYVLVPAERFPVCQLTAAMNWGGETHLDIIGPDGTLENPQGPYANWPRYYIKKILLPGPEYKIKIVALLNPQGRVLGRLNNPRFGTQLWSIICRRGIIEFARMGPPEKVVRGEPRPGTCGIEELLADICMNDPHVGRLPNRNSIFIPRQGISQQEYQYSLNGADGLVANCQDFLVIWLPSRHHRTNDDHSARFASQQIIWYLNAAKQANFDGVLMEGWGLGPVRPDDTCDPAKVGWSVFPVDYLIGGLFTDGETVRSDLIQRTSGYGLRKQWYLCKNA